MAMDTALEPNHLGLIPGSATYQLNDRGENLWISLLAKRCITITV